MSRYLEIRAVQRPFQFNADENSRDMFSVNFDATAAAPVNAWEEEIAAVLVASGECTGLDTDIFVGTSSRVPTGDGPYVTIVDTGGTGGRPSTKNGNYYEQMSAQIVVRGKYRTARTRALAIWRALDGIRNTTLTA